MHKDALLNMLKTHNVNDDDLDLFKEKLKEKSFDMVSCDRLLLKLGYETLFGSDEDDNEDEFDSFNTYEKKPHKHNIEN